MSDCFSLGRDACGFQAEYGKGVADGVGPVLAGGRYVVASVDCAYDVNAAERSAVHAEGLGHDEKLARTSCCLGNVCCLALEECDRGVATLGEGGGVLARSDNRQEGVCRGAGAKAREGTVGLLLAVHP